MKVSISIFGPFLYGKVSCAKDMGIKMEYKAIAEAFRRHAFTTPGRICVIDDSGSYTYAQMCSKAGLLCKMIYDMGIGEQERIVVECTQNANFLLMAMACQIGRFIFVPVERAANINKIKEICNETDAGLFVYATEYNLEIDILRISFEQLTEKISRDRTNSGIENTDYAFDGKEIAEILYTTGTTGSPKGIAITNYCNVAIAENIVFGTRMSNDNVELVPLPLSHSHGLRTCYAGILNGSTVVIKDGVMNVADIYTAIEKHKVTALDLSPSAARILLKLAKKRLSEFADQMDYVEIGTAFLDEEIKVHLRAIFPKTRLYNFYGSTEAGRSCILDFRSMQKKTGCIGQPSRHARFVVLGEDGSILNSSKENMGFLAVTGGMMMEGYWNDKGTSDNLMVNEYLKTSDIGYIDQEGFVYVFGRADDVINYKGIKISPEEIEEPALKYDSVIDCACVPLADKMCGFVPKLYIQVDSRFDMQEFKEYLLGEIDQSRFPKRIEVIEEIPRTYNGKLHRKALKERTQKGG